MNMIVLALLLFLKSLLLGTDQFFRVYSAPTGAYFFLMLLTAVSCALIVRKAEGRSKPFATLLGILLFLDPFINSYTLSVFTLGAYLFCLLPLFARLYGNVSEKKALALSCFTSAAAAALAPAAVGGMVLFSNLTLCFVLGDLSPKALLRRMLPATLTSAAGCCAASLASQNPSILPFLYRIDYFSAAIMAPSGLRFLESFRSFSAKEMITTVALPLLILIAGFRLTKLLQAKGRPKNAPAFDACRRELMILVPFTVFTAVFFSALKLGYAPCLFLGVMILIVFFRHDEAKEELLAFLKQNTRYLLPLLILISAGCTLLVNEYFSLFGKAVVFY